MPSWTGLSKKLDINVVWSTPLRATEDRRVYSAIVDQENLKKLLSALKMIGEIEKTTYRRPSYSAHGVLACLTPR